MGRRLRGIQKAVKRRNKHSSKQKHIPIKLSHDRKPPECCGSDNIDGIRLNTIVELNHNTHPNDSQCLSPSNGSRSAGPCVAVEDSTSHTPSKGSRSAGPCDAAEDRTSHTPSNGSRSAGLYEVVEDSTSHTPSNGSRSAGPYEVSEDISVFSPSNGSRSAGPYKVVEDRSFTLSRAPNRNSECQTCEIESPNISSISFPSEIPTTDQHLLTSSHNNNDDDSSDDNDFSRSDRRNPLVPHTNNIDFTDDSSSNNYVLGLESNFRTNNEKQVNISYSTRRRYIRNLKDYIFSLGNLDVQASILSDFLKDSDMKEVLEAAGIHSPVDSSFNEQVVNQVMKQINRSSEKNSIRGRVTDDRQSYKINITAAIMKSPSSNVSASFDKKKYINMLHSRTSLSRSSARRLVIKAHHQRKKLTSSEKNITWSIISHRHQYNTKQKSISFALFEWIINHPHVVASPILRDTVWVKVPHPNGETSKQQVGKLLIEISIRELHQDLMKPPPVGLSEAFCNDTKKLLISERHLRSNLPPQLKPITFSQKQLCGCESCTVMKMLHTSLVKYRKTFLLSQRTPSRVTRSRHHNTDPIMNYSQILNCNDTL